MHEILKKIKNDNICFNIKINNCCWYMKNMIIKYQDLKSLFVIIIILNSSEFKPVFQLN